MIKNIIFDLGQVLVDWDPRYLYRTLTDDEEKIEHFLSTVCTPEKNHLLDLGMPWQEWRDDLVAQYPDHADWIEMYWTRWLDMFSGPIHESVDILMELKRMGMPIYALTNWNDEKMDIALKEFPFFNLFDGRVVSGIEKLAKPDPEFYQILLDRYDLNPRECLFTDDKAENVQAARDLGIEAVLFTSPAALESDLVKYGVFPDDEEGDDDEEFHGCGGGCTCHSR